MRKGEREKKAESLIYISVGQRPTNKIESVGQRPTNKNELRIKN
jgi:hypothetical protein